MDLHEEFRMLKPPFIDREVEEVVEAWIINMNKYFQVYKYNDNRKARIDIYQL